MTRPPSSRGLRLTFRGQPLFIDTGRIPASLDLPAGSVPWLLLHGALNDQRVWRPHTRALARSGSPALALAWPGHGPSGGPALTGVEEMAECVIEVMDALGLRQVALAGHSMGSLAALEAAARLGSRARALLLVGTAAPMRVAPAMLELAQRDPASATLQIGQFSVAQPKAAEDEAPPPEAAIRRARRIRQRLEALMQQTLAAHGAQSLLHTDLQACDLYAHALERAREVQCPTWLLGGSKDKMTPAKATLALQEALGERLAGVHLLDSGHTLMAEQAQGVLALLRHVDAAIRPSACG